MNAVHFGSDSVSDLLKPDFIGFPQQKFALDVFA